ncbi:hypothetical protein BD413DRAFT_526771 [Trametes elegans]|nr:hypothetical protein BD413DRAFT_526771 [Trametes elegans]
MGPVRRSQRNAKASSSKTKLESEVESGPVDDGVDQTHGETLQSLLVRASGAVQELENENTALRKKVKALELRLARVEDDTPVQPRRSKRTASTAAAQLHSEMALLKKQVRRLKKSNEKYRKKYHQLSIKEVEDEVEDLLETADYEVGDSAHKMRKLLRRFHDLMLENSLDENEECLICFETLHPKKSRSLPCQHTFCNECVRRLWPEPVEPESIRCPQCREVCARDEAELVELTASQQWDALLEVAKKWARMDVRREESTSEEEDAEQFIDDDPEELILRPPIQL